MKSDLPRQNRDLERAQFQGMAVPLYCIEECRLWLIGTVCDKLILASGKRWHTGCGRR